MTVIYPRARGRSERSGRGGAPTAHGFVLDAAGGAARDVDIRAALTAAGAGAAAERAAAGVLVARDLALGTGGVLALLRGPIRVGESFAGVALFRVHVPHLPSRAALEASLARTARTRRPLAPA